MRRSLLAALAIPVLISVIMDPDSRPRPPSRRTRREPPGFPGSLPRQRVKVPAPSTQASAVTLAELETDRHPVLARLRSAAPVSWVPVLGAWLVTGYDLAVEVLCDARTFTVDDPRFSTVKVVGALVRTVRPGAK